MAVPTHRPNCETMIWRTSCPDCFDRVYFFSYSCGCLAEKLGVYRSHLAGIETGSVNPSVKTLEKLAAALDVTVEALFRGDQL